MKYTASDIQLMRMKSTICKLTGPAMWWSEDADKLTEVCNGVGADWMPDWAVDALTYIYIDYAEAAAIHDCRYYLKEGTQEEADNEFNENCLKLWQDRYGKMRWFSPSAWKDRLKIRAAYKTLQKCGDKAWNKENKSNVNV